MKEIHACFRPGCKGTPSISQYTQTKWRWWSNGWGEDGEATYYYVVCDECGLRSEDCGNIDTAIEWWNGES